MIIYYIFFRLKGDDFEFKKIINVERLRGRPQAGLNAQNKDQNKIWMRSRYTELSQIIWNQYT